VRHDKQVWEIGVLIDKSNATARVQAWTRRWLPDTEHARRVMAMLPLPATAEAVTHLVDARRRLLRQVGIRQSYSARRTAATQADDEALDPGQVLGHRPGSASTPGYVGATTPAALLDRLRPL
jgi:hypothetical protein